MATSLIGAAPRSAKRTGARPQQLGKLEAGSPCALDGRWTKTTSKGNKEELESEENVKAQLIVVMPTPHQPKTYSSHATTTRCSSTHGKCGVHACVG